MARILNEQQLPQVFIHRNHRLASSCLISNILKFNFLKPLKNRNYVLQTCVPIVVEVCSFALAWSMGPTNHMTFKIKSCMVFVIS